MNPYELMLIFNPSLGDEKIGQTISKVEERIKSLGGAVKRTEKWGIKRLATPFQKHKKLSQVYYTVIFFESASDLPPRIQPVLKVTEEILRYSIYKSSKEELEGAVKEVLPAAVPGTASQPKKSEEIQVDFSKLEEKEKGSGQS